MPKNSLSLPDKAGEPSARRQAQRGGVTRLLHSWSEGDEAALKSLVPLVYDELRKLARYHLCGERDDHTLRGTALVHETFMRLLEHRSIHIESRAQFFAWVSQVMRRILVNHARARNAAKRGAGLRAESLDALESDGVPVDEKGAEELANILELDGTLNRLTLLDPQKSRVVELRFFGGLTVLEVAEALEISTATVKREWAAARAWLQHELEHLNSSRHGA